MDIEKNQEYYFEKLKSKGLNLEKYLSERMSYTHKYAVFPNEKVFMNWLIDEDFIDIGGISNALFSIYSNPSSEENIIINKYIKDENRQAEISDLLDECTENRLYLLKIITSIKNYSVDDLIKIHEEIFDKTGKLKEKISKIMDGTLEYFRKQEKKKKGEQYIG